MIDTNALAMSMQGFKENFPFDHCVIDNFFNVDFAECLEKEFPDYHSNEWFHYDNPLEEKKALNDWNTFPYHTYQLFRYLVSPDFVTMLSDLVGTKLFADPGLHGGGWHIHCGGGNLNPHLDYSIHPKCSLQRKINIIIYLSREFQPEFGGELGLWEHDYERNLPGDLAKSIAPLFNRAVIFDTTQNSWHGMVSRITTQKEIYRKSLAIYYLTSPDDETDPRQKALYAPRAHQSSDAKVLELIRKRADSKSFSSVYK